MRARTQDEVRTRTMALKDLAEVVAIERASFTPAWTEDDFAHCLSPASPDRHAGVVAVARPRGRDEEVLGFVVATRLTIVSLAVRPDARRRGVGRRLVAHLTRSVTPHSPCREVTAVVRESNLSAQLFFKALEFRAVEVLRGHFDDSGEDGYLFRWPPESAEALP